MIAIRASLGSMRCRFLALALVACNGAVDETPPQLPGGPRAGIALASGLDTSCAVTSAGEVACWGMEVGWWDIAWSNSHQRGTYALSPLLVDGVSGAVAVSQTSDSRGCAVLEDGRVQCWGDNSFGALGNGMVNPPFAYQAPVFVSGISTATAVVSTFEHGCALLSGGGVQCWGFNVNGSLGDGTRNNSANPITVPGVTTAVAMAGGESGTGGSTCVLLGDQSVRCWGVINCTVDVPDQQCVPHPPTTITGLSGAKKIFVAAYHRDQPRGCAVLQDDTVACWPNAQGNLAASPETSVKSVVSLAIGDRYTCALLHDATVACWGANDFGQLGNGTTVAAPLGVVLGLSDVVEVSAGNDHTCARLSNGGIRCWGHNLSGQLGDGKGNPKNNSDPPNSSAVPVAVKGFL